MGPQRIRCGSVVEAVPPIGAQLPADGRWVLLIDGRSGAGKTTLAEAVAAAAPTAQCVHLDALYPGWEGLAAAQEILATQILRAVRPGYVQWDWARGRQGPWVALDPTRPLVIEGSGAITPATAAQATLCVWVELDAATRQQRAFTRDPDYPPYWQLWAAQERRHLEVHRPRQRAQLIIDVDPRLQPAEDAE